MAAEAVVGGDFGDTQDESDEALHGGREERSEGEEDDEERVDVEAERVCPPPPPAPAGKKCECGAAAGTGEVTTGGELMSGCRHERSNREDGRWACEWEEAEEEDETVAELAATTGKSKKDRNDEGEKVEEELIAAVGIGCAVTRSAARAT